MSQPRKTVRWSCHPWDTADDDETIAHPNVLRCSLTRKVTTTPVSGRGAETRRATEDVTTWQFDAEDLPDIIYELSKLLAYYASGDRDKDRAHEMRPTRKV